MAGHITREGNKWLRRNLVEYARVAVEKKDLRLKNFHLNVKHEKSEKNALIAVTKEVGCVCVLMLKRSQTYEELSPWFIH